MTVSSMDSVIRFENLTAIWYVANDPRFDTVSVFSVVSKGKTASEQDLQTTVKFPRGSTLWVQLIVAEDDVMFVILILDGADGISKQNFVL